MIFSKNYFTQMQNEFTGESNKDLLDTSTLSTNMSNKDDFQDNLENLHRRLALASAKHEAAALSKAAISDQLAKTMLDRFEVIKQGDSKLELENTMAQLSWELSAPYQNIVKSKEVTDFLASIPCSKERGNKKNNHFISPFKGAVKKLADHWTDENSKLLDGYNVKLHARVADILKGGTGKTVGNNPEDNTTMVSVFVIEPEPAKAEGSSDAPAPDNGQGEPSDTVNPSGSMSGGSVEAIANYIASLDESQQEQQAEKIITAILNSLPENEGNRVANRVADKQAERVKDLEKGETLKTQILEIQADINRDSGKLAELKKLIGKAQEDLAEYALQPKSTKKRLAELKANLDQLKVDAKGYSAALQAQKAKLSKAQAMKTEWEKSYRKSA